MHSPKMSIAMATLVYGLLVAPASPTAVAPEKARGSNCPGQCGDISIPYPFGIGPECSLPGFNLTCAAGANTSNLLLGNPSIEVWDLGPTLPGILANISYFVKLSPAQNYSVHWEAPGRPFAISGSSNMALFVVGCSFKATLFVGDSGVEVGNCNATCLGYQTMSMMSYVPCVGMGCCSISITVTTLRSFTLNISRTGQVAQGLEQVSAFITNHRSYMFQASDLQRPVQYYQTLLSWAIPNQLNCNRAMEDKATYACVSNHSICQEAPIGGYVCKCSQGFYCNPYIVNGCVLPSGGRNCPDLCGDIPISYPFGIGPECSLLPGFNLTCAAGAHNTSNLLLGNPSIGVWEFDSAYVDYSFPAILTNISYVVKLAPAQNYSVHWEAPGIPFAISGSSNMSLFVVGCNVKATLFFEDYGLEAGCSAACHGYQTMRMLPHVPCVGIGCCSIDITVTLRSFTLNISRTGQAPQGLEQVSMFIAEQDYYQSVPYYPYSSALSWAIPSQLDCNRAMEDRYSYACVSSHSICQEAPIGGYVCNCSQGFYGNPYVVDGCVSPDSPALAPAPSPSDAVHEVYDSMQPKENCPTLCGNISIAFPFGTELGCFAKLPLYLTCNPRPSPILQMPDGSVVTAISIDEGILRILNLSDTGSSLVYLGASLYAFSGEHGVLRWAVDNKTCKDAMASEDYRCFSNSDCLDVTDQITLNHVGYQCKCSGGFGGNPYIRYGCSTNSGRLQRESKLVILGVTIGVSSGGGILFLGAAFALLTRKWKRSVQKQLRKRCFLKNKGILLEQLISSDEQSASDGTKIFSLEELEKATNNFDPTRVVGRGGHGTVYKGILSDQRVVAIKRSKVEAGSEIEQFINEVSILSRINHRNVVKLHGCCLEAEVPLLVYEFVSNGTLYELLHHDQNVILLPVPWEERLRIAIEIAGALMYLHSAASVSILHRDVKSMNVLLNDSYIAKVSDFGASRSIPIDQTHLVTAVQGTFGYLDPEYYHTGQLNEKSDVYSFGVILLELLTRKKPIFENENGEKQNLSNYFLGVIGEKPLEEVIDMQILSDESEDAIASVAGLAEECLSLTRWDRPTMKDVEMRLQMLRGRQSVAPPRCDGERINVLGGAVPVPAGQHGSRQYSLEQELLSSSRVPR